MTRYLIDTATEMAQLVAVLAALAALAALIVGPRRTGRVLAAVIGVARRHAPRWLMIVLNVALAIPGPVDEAIVLGIIGVLIATRPAMRADAVASVRAAWAGSPALTPTAAVNVTITRRVRWGTVAGKLAAAAIAAGLIVAPVTVTLPTANAASGAASFIIGHARHHHGHR